MMCKEDAGMPQGAFSPVEQAACGGRSASEAARLSPDSEMNALKRAKKAMVLIDSIHSKLLMIESLTMQGDPTGASRLMWNSAEVDLNGLRVLTIDWPFKL